MEKICAPRKLAQLPYDTFCKIGGCRLISAFQRQYNGSETKKRQVRVTRVLDALPGRLWTRTPTGHAATCLLALPDSCRRRRFGDPFTRIISEPSFPGSRRFLRRPVP